jgi:hypothetical protein
MNIAKQLDLFSNEAAPQGLHLCSVSGRNYRCIRKPDSNLDLGRWEFEYKGNWHDVLNRQIRSNLNKLAGYYAR